MSETAKNAYREAAGVYPNPAGLEAVNEQWCQWGIVEIAVRNHSVAEYMEHWEGRATKAESELASLREQVTSGTLAPQRIADIIRERDALRESNGKLVEALKTLRDTMICQNYKKHMEMVDAALAAHPKQGEPQISNDARN